MAISYRMQMIRHDDVGINGKPCRLSSLSESVASYDFDRVGAKYWKAVFGYRGQNNRLAYLVKWYA